MIKLRDYIKLVQKYGTMNKRILDYPFLAYAKLLK